MREITTFVGAKEGPWWKKEGGGGPGKGHHVPIVEKIENDEDVRKYLRYGFF